MFANWELSGDCASVRYVCGVDDTVTLPGYTNVEPRLRPADGEDFGCRRTSRICAIRYYLNADGNTHLAGFASRCSVGLIARF